jgi:hypothetical protein
MTSTSKVYTPTIVKELAPPIYRPPVVVEEATSKSPPQVNDMYLTKEETEEGTIWNLNIVSDNEQEYKYRLYVNWD